MLWLFWTGFTFYNDFLESLRELCFALAGYRFKFIREIPWWQTYRIVLPLVTLLDWDWRLQCLVKKMIGKHTSCTLMIITECTICARTRRWIQPEYNVASSGRSSLPQIHCCLNNISKMVLTCLVAASTKLSDQTWTPEILEDRKVAGKFGSQRSGSVPLPRIILGCTKHTA